MLNDYPVIKQIMPLPNGYTVLTPTYATSTLNVCDPISVVYDDKCFYGTSYCLALVHDPDGFDYVAAHEIEVEGLGELEDHLIFAPIKMCPKCGERMFIHMENGYSATLNYSCHCGTKFTINRKCPVPEIYENVKPIDPA